MADRTCDGHRSALPSELRLYWRRCPLLAIQRESCQETCRTTTSRRCMIDSKLDDACEPSGNVTAARGCPRVSCESCTAAPRPAWRSTQRAGRQGPVHRLAGGRAGGGARLRIARERGDGRAWRQGRDARARRRPTCRGRWPARCRRAAPGAGQARGSVERVYVGARGCTSASSARSSTARGRCASANPADPGTQVGPLASPRRVAHVQRARRRTRSRTARSCAAADRCSPPGCGSVVLRTRPWSAARRTRCACCASRSTDRCSPSSPSTRSARRSRSPTTGDYGLGASSGRRPLPRDAHRARAARRNGVAQRPPPRARRSRAGPWGAAAGSGLGRTLGEAGLRACGQEKLIAWSPPQLRGLWWGPYDEAARARGAHGRPSCARRATSTAARRAAAAPRRSRVRVRARSAGAAAIAAQAPSQSSPIPSTTGGGGRRLPF